MFGFIKDSINRTDIFMTPNNLGYIVNINNEKMRQEYEAFNLREGISNRYPQSSAERMRFEAEIIKKYPAEYTEYKNRILYKKAASQ